MSDSDDRQDDSLSDEGLRIDGKLLLLNVTTAISITLSVVYSLYFLFVGALTAILYLWTVAQIDLNRHSAFIAARYVEQGWIEKLAVLYVIALLTLLGADMGNFIQLSRFQVNLGVGLGGGVIVFAALRETVIAKDYLNPEARKQALGSEQTEEV